MPDIDDGESVQVQGSGATPYTLRNTGGVYSCSCPAWRNQSTAIERRTCKHLRKYRGDEAETARLGGQLPARPVRKAATSPADGAPAADEGPPVMLAERWDGVADLTGWWMSEKLDGVRAYWDGTQFLSRLGNAFVAPKWFTEALPDVPLDGELWLARKAFQRTVSIARRKDASEHWRELCFLVFDAPLAAGAFEERVRAVEAHVGEGRAPFARAHTHHRCEGVEHLRAELRRVEGLGGEGLMLRRPGSRYEVGRTASLLKVKSFLDAEALVIGHQAGAGRHKGRLGALLVQLADGTKFSVGTGFSDAERESPPPVGATVTFRYQELSDGGVPRFPSYVGVRDDVKPVVVAPAPQPVKTAAPAGAGQARRFEFTGGTSSKFWEVRVDGADMTVRYGRIGSAGQTKTRTFADAAEAQRQADKLISEKTGEGYREAAP